jgi:hypothetical protein
MTVMADNPTVALSWNGPTPFDPYDVAVCPLKTAMRPPRWRTASTRPLNCCVGASEITALPSGLEWMERSASEWVGL